MIDSMKTYLELGRTGMTIWSHSARVVTDEDDLSNDCYACDVPEVQRSFPSFVIFQGKFWLQGLLWQMTSTPHQFRTNKLLSKPTRINRSMPLYQYICWLKNQSKRLTVEYWPCRTTTNVCRWRNRVGRSDWVIQNLLDVSERGAVYLFGSSER